MRWLVKYDGEVLGSVLTNHRMSAEEICDFASVDLARTQEEYENSPENGKYILDELEIVLDIENETQEDKEMLNFKEFIEKALEGNGVQNDEKDVWINVNGEQYTLSVESVLGREEQEPFEASYALENDLEHEAWEDFYDSYKEDYKAKHQKYQVTDWYMNGENGEIVGTCDNLEEARECAQEYVSRIRKTKKESESSYIDICPLLEDERLGDAVEIFHYDPVKC